MDQDSFRRLLSSSSQSQTRAEPRESLFTQKGSSKPTKTATVSSSEAPFKPRKIKKVEGKYRDRAAERRIGEGNDYAQVEAVLEEFEKRTADQDKDAVNEQRRYLGGDGEHTVLVKGLDMALLQQNKARAAMTTDEDDSLEKAYAESTVPKKRTREDIIRELKEKRAQGASSEQSKEASEDVTLHKGKFKPIGFKPIGASTEEKKKKVKGEGEKKKKKRKVEAGSSEKVEAPATTTNSSQAVQDQAPAIPATPSVSASVPAMALPTPVELEEPEPTEDFDIFAGAGEYEGIDLEDDEDEDEAAGRKRSDKKEEVDLPDDRYAGLGPGRWFATDEPDPEPSAKAETQSSEPVSSHPEADIGSIPGSNSHPPQEDENMSEEEEKPTRLVPLSSSALPSIKDFLAMDEAAETAEKKRKRKEKKKGIKDDSSSKKLDAEAKANRDYQRLKSYTDKRGESSK